MEELALQDFKSEALILEWNIVDSYSNYYNEIDAVNSLPSSGVELVFEIERDFQYYLFKVIFPIDINFISFMVCVFGYILKS